MPEYLGYVSPSQTTNWYETLKPIQTKLGEIGEKIKKERESLASIEKENEDLLKSYQPGKTQNINEMVLSGVNGYKDKAREWKDKLKTGEAKWSDYKNFMNNAKDNWNILANTAKTFDQRFQESMTRQNEGKASSFEMELLNRFGQMADVTKNTPQWDENGNLYMVNKDANGKIVGEIFDVRSMSLPDNIISNSINVSDAVNSLVENWDPWTVWQETGNGGELTITDVRENKKVFGPMLAQVAETIASDANPRAQVSVLDNGVIDAEYYLTDDEYKQKRQEGINEALQLKKTAGLPQELTPEEIKRIEFNLIKMEKDAKGIINPVLTEEQKKAAKDRVMQEVEIQLGRKVTGTPQRTYKEGDGSGNGSGASGDVDTALYDRLAEAWKTADVSTLNSYLKNKTAYKVAKSKKNPNQYAVYKISKDELTGDSIESEIVSSSNLEDFIPYYYGTGAAAEKKARQQIDAYRSRNRGSSSTGKQKAY